MVVCVADVLRNQTRAVIEALGDYEDIIVAEEEVVPVTAAVAALEPWLPTMCAVHEQTCEAWGVELLKKGVQRQRLEIQNDPRGVLIQYFKGARKACTRAAVVLAKSNTLHKDPVSCDAVASSSSAAVACPEDVDGKLTVGFGSGRSADGSQVPDTVEQVPMQLSVQSVGQLLRDSEENLRKDLEVYNDLILKEEDQARLHTVIAVLENTWTTQTRVENRKICLEWGVQVKVASVWKTLGEIKAELLEKVKGFLREKVAVGDVPGNAVERPSECSQSVGDLLGDAADGALQEFKAFQSLTLPEADKERVAAAFVALVGSWSRSHRGVHEETCGAWEVQRYRDKGKKRKAVADLQVELRARVRQYLEEVRRGSARCHGPGGAPNLLMEHGPLTVREAAVVAQQPDPALRRRARSKQAGVVPISAELKDALQLLESGASLTRQQKEPLLRLGGCKLRRRFGRSVVWLDSVPHLSLAVFCVLREVRMMMLRVFLINLQ